MNFHYSHYFQRTACDNRIYMVGGWDTSSTSVTHVHTCSMTALLQSCQLSTQSELPHSSIWRQVANVPVRMCPCVTLQNRLVVIGWKNSTDKPTKTVHLYNEAKDAYFYCTYSFTSSTPSRVHQWSNSKALS